MKNSSKIIFLMTCMLLVFTACGGRQTMTGEKQQASSTGTDPLLIYTSVFPLKDFAEKIGGKHVDAKLLLPPGTDAHTFEPTPQTMIQIAESDAFLYIGYPLESYLPDLKTSLAGERVQFFQTTKGVRFLAYAEEHAHAHAHAHEHAHENDAHNENEENENEHMHEQHENEKEHEHAHSADRTHHQQKNEVKKTKRDPHVWLDPLQALIIAENVKEILSELKPTAKKDFEQNYQTLKKRLLELDADFQKMAAKAPKKVFLTAHAAYGYWEDRYGLIQLSASGLTPTDEPSQKELQHLVNLAEEYDIQYVLFEQNVSSRVSRVIQREIGAKALTIHNLASPTRQQLEKGADYFRLMQKNLKTLKKALYE